MHHGGNTDQITPIIIALRSGRRPQSSGPESSAPNPELRSTSYMIRFKPQGLLHGKVSGIASVSRTDARTLEIILMKLPPFLRLPRGPASYRGGGLPLYRARSISFRVAFESPQRAWQAQMFGPTRLHGIGTHWRWPSPAPIPRAVLIPRSLVIRRRPTWERFTSLRQSPLLISQICCLVHRTVARNSHRSASPPTKALASRTCNQHTLQYHHRHMCCVPSSCLAAGAGRTSYGAKAEACRGLPTRQGRRLGS